MQSPSTPSINEGAPESVSDSEENLEEALTAINKNLYVDLPSRYASVSELHSNLRMIERQIQEAEDTHKLNMDELLAHSTATEKEIAELMEQHTIAVAELRQQYGSVPAI